MYVWQTAYRRGAVYIDLVSAYIGLAWLTTSDQSAKLWPILPSNSRTAKEKLQQEGRTRSEWVAILMIHH